MTEEKISKFIYGGYGDKRYEKVLFCMNSHKKEKQEKREKQKKEEEETAAVYNDFVKSFEQPSNPATSAPLFVRGGTINDKVSFIMIKLNNRELL